MAKNNKTSTYFKSYTLQHTEQPGLFCNPISYEIILTKSCYYDYASILHEVSTFPEFNAYLKETYLKYIEKALKM